MGLAALLFYALFLWTPLKSLRRITRETFDVRRTSRLYYLAAGIQASLVAYMVASFFASVAYYWNVYYLVGYAVCLRRLYEAEATAAVEKGRTAETDAADVDAGASAREEDFGGGTSTDAPDVRVSEPHAAGV
jgi:hypothetical protein